MTYIIENNGVYGLTKGQVSPSADVGSRPKKGDPNVVPPIDPMELGLALGATFLARGFSGDKDQLVPLIKAAVAHRGFALLDVISPCVSFNDHEGSTKSYRFFREHEVHEIETDFVPQRAEIRSKISSDSARAVTMHDGSVTYFRALPEGYNPTDRVSVEAYLAERKAMGEVPTGLLFLREGAPDLHDMSGTVRRPLADLDLADLCPGNDALQRLQESLR
jgi:2-oxoglutarate ferredoxin oxidoreductase subunit beta